VSGETAVRHVNILQGKLCALDMIPHARPMPASHQIQLNFIQA